MKPVLMILAFCVGVISVMRCQSVKPAEYGLELDACVANAKTLAESQACRCHVNESYGRPCTPPIPSTPAPDAGEK
jgi:hypothetical protein